MRLTLQTLTRRCRGASWAPWLAVLTLVGASSSALAGPIEVNNASFEREGLDPGGWNNELTDTNNPISGSDWLGAAGSNSGDAFIEYIDGFNSEGNQHLGMQSGYYVFQNTGVAFEANSNYTLIVGVGNRNEGFSPAGALAIVGLTNLEAAPAADNALAGANANAQLADDPVLAGASVLFDSGTLGGSSFHDVKVEFSTGDEPPAGNIVIFLGDDESGGRAHFDNVRLFSQPAGKSIAGDAEYYTATHATAPVALDGSLAEWAGDPIVNPQFRLGADAIGLDVFEPWGGGTYTGPEDQSTSTWMTWDSGSLYLGVVVTDDYHEHAATGAGNTWNGDSLQLHVANAARDTRVALYNFALEGVEGDTGAVSIHIESAPAEGAADGVSAAITREGTQTVYEICLPAASLGLEALGLGTQLGIGFALNDGDETEPGQKGWGGLSPHTVVFGKTPSETALVTLGGPAGELRLDFGTTGPNANGSAPGWIGISNLAQDIPVSLGGGVSITALEDGFNPNNPAGPGADGDIGGRIVPQNVLDDYLFKITDAAGTSAQMRIDGLAAGDYDVTVFEGRTTDSGQMGVIWVGEEPADPNTGDFAAGKSGTVRVSVAEGDAVHYRHLEDGSGGISGMIITPVPTTPVPQLVAHFPLDADGNSADGAFEGAATDVEYTEGRFGNAAVFNGTSSVIQHPHSSDLNPQSFTLSLWAKSDGGAGAWNSPVTSRHDQFANGEMSQGFLIYDNNPDGVWTFWSGNGPDAGNWQVLDGPPVTVGEWEHVAITYDDASQTKRLYVNGELAAEANDSITPNDTTPFNIGAGQDFGDGFWFVGCIDDIGLWDGALSQEAIQNVMMNGVDPKITGVAEVGLDGDDPAIIASSFGEEALTFSDRTHQHNGAAFDDDGVLSTSGANIVPLPDYLVGQSYVRFANNARENAEYAATVTTSDPCYFYLLVDNRVNGPAGDNSSPNTEDAVLGGALQWIVDGGWQRVNTGISPGGQADYTAVDESGDGEGPGVGLNQFYSVWTLPAAQTEVTVHSNRIGGNNMISLVVSSVEAAPAPEFNKLWVLGVDDGGQGEFSQEKGTDEAPGSASVQDDDFYFAGTYPDPIGTVAEDEPTANYDRAHTPGDTFNRIHFNLDEEAAASDTHLRFTADLCCLGAAEGIASEHDLTFRFNGTEFHVEAGITADTLVQQTFTAGEVGAVAGANTIEIERTAGADSSWVQYDYLCLEATAGSAGPGDGGGDGGGGDGGGGDAVPGSVPANSIADFGGPDSAGNGWGYGYRVIPADATSPDYDPAADFIPFPESWWNGEAWDFPDGNVPWTTIGLESSHPNGDNNGEIHATIRRWVSPGGAVDATWHLSKQNVNCGNGVTGSLHVNGVQVDSATIAGDDAVGVTRTVGLDLAAGDVVDLVHSSLGLDGTYNDGCDGSLTRLDIGAPLGDGLLAYYPLDGDIEDYAGDSHGEAMGADPLAYDTGKFGQGVDLNGVDQFIQTPTANEDLFDFGAPDAPTGFTVSAWFRVDGFTKGWQALIAKGEGNRWRIHRRGDSNLLTGNGGNGDVPEGTTDVNDGELHHIALVSDPANDIARLYIDGVLEAENSGLAREGNDMPMMIGENPDARNRTWDGLIDDVAIWARPLSEGEVGRVFSASASLGELTGVTAILADVTQPGDPVVLVSGENDDDGNAGDPPGAEGVENAINDIGQKYLNFLDLGSGLIVTPQVGASTVSAVAFYTANDAPERDPASYRLEGSAAGPDGPWTLISQGALALPDDRNPGGDTPITEDSFGQTVSFLNDWAYTSYRLTFPTLKNAGAANSMQIAEIELLGVPGGNLDNRPPLIACWDFQTAEAVPTRNDLINGVAGELIGDASLVVGGGVSGQAGDVALDLSSGAGSLLVDGAFLNDAMAGNSVSVMFWQKLRNVTNQTTFKMQSPSSSGGERGWSTHSPWGDQTIYYDTAGCCDGGTQRISASAADAVTWDEWNHFTFVKDGDSKQIFINGVLFAEGTNTAPLPSDITQLWIGSGTDGAESLDGWLDEFRIFGGAMDEAAIASYLEFKSLPLPPDADSDGDGLPDLLELELFGSIEARDGTGDFDGDRLNDATEVLLGTDLTNPDTDGDGLIDGAEVIAHHTDPLNADSDGDGLGDLAEINDHGTDPNDEDTDNDGETDASELAAGPSSVLYDFETDPGLEIINFSGEGIAPEIRSEGGNPGGYLSLTDAVNGARATVIFPDTTGGANIAGFKFSVDARTGGGTPDPADGMSISLVRPTDPVLQEPRGDGFAGTIDLGAGEENLPEEGTQTGVSVGFDEWVSGGSDIIGISTRVDGELISQVAAPVKNGDVTDPLSLQTGPRLGDDPAENLTALGWAPIDIELNVDGRLNVSWKGSKIVEDVQTNWTPSPGQLVFAARTGGANGAHHFDNLSLTIVPEGSRDPALFNASAGEVLVHYDFSPPAGNDPVYAQNFDGIEDGATDVGDGSILSNPQGGAQIIGGALQLTVEGIGGQNANFKTPSLSGLGGGFSASFDVALSEELEGNPPADGFSFNLGNIADDATAGEEGFGSGLAVEFDTWNNGGEGADNGIGIDISVDGADVAINRAAADADPNANEFFQFDGVSRPVHIDYAPAADNGGGGVLNVTYGDLVIADNLPVAWAPQDGDRVAFGARTGGAWETVLLDNLVITPAAGGGADGSVPNLGSLADGTLVGADLLAQTPLGEPTMTWTELAGNNSITTFNGAFDGADVLDGTWRVLVDFEAKTEGDPELVFETGGGTIGLSLVYDAPSTLIMRAVGNGGNDVITAHAPLSQDQLDAGALEVIFVHDANANGPETISVYLDGALAGSATGEKSNDFSGGNGASFGLGTASLAAGGGNTNLPGGSVDFASGAIQLDPGLQFFRNTAYYSGPALVDGSLVRLGTETYVDTGYTAAELGVNGNEATYTMLARINPSRVAGDNMVFGQGGGNALHNGIRNGAWHFGHWGNDITVGSAEVGHWYDVAFRYGGGLQTIVVNGEVVDAQPRGGLNNPDENILIGLTRLGEDRAFQGLIDEVMIVSGALSLDKIRSLQGVGEPAASQLLVQYDFEDGITTTIRNNGNLGAPDGTLNSTDVIGAYAHGESSPSLGGPNAMFFNERQGLDGTFIDIGLTAAEAGVNGPTNYTMMAWAKPTRASNGDQMIFGQPDGNALHNGIRDQRQHIGHWGNDLNAGAARVAFNKWSHFAYSYDAAGNQRIYVDGVLVAEENHGPLNNPDQPVTIGATRSATGDDRDYEGYLDDVRIYSGTLNATEIAQVAGLVDSDGDGLLDSFERANFGDLAQDGTGDPDGDGISNADEERLGLNPNENDAEFADVDQDGWTAGDEGAFGTSDTNAAAFPQVFAGGGQWEVRVVQGEDGTLTNLAAADALLSGESAALYDETIMTDFINFGDGGNGLFGGDQTWPNEADADQNDFLAEARGTIEVLIPGTIVFNLRTDDGGRVRINGQDVWVDDSLHGDRDGIFEVTLGPGLHEVEALFFERGGGDNMELTGTVQSDFDLTGLGGGGFTLVPAAPPVTDPPPAGLLAYWPFDEGDGNPVDLVNNVAGVLTNGPTHVEGFLGGGIDFGADNAGGQTLVVNPTILEPIAATNSFTITFWQKLTAIANGSTFWANAEGQERAFQAHVPWSNGNVYLDTAGCCDGATQRINAPVETPLDVWEHWVFVKDGDSKSVYKNGVLAFSGENTGPIAPSFTNLWIGSGPDGGNSLPGALDEFSIWSRALGEDEIARLASGEPVWVPGMGGGVLRPTRTATGTVASVDDLDLDGDIVYAVNMGGVATTVAGMDFTTEDDTAGLDFYAQNEIPAWNPPVATGDAGLDEVLNSIRWTAASNDPPSVDADFDVTPGYYQVTLLFAEKCCERGFDVFVNGEHVADDLSPDTLQGGPDGRGVVGSYLRVTTEVSGGDLDISLNGIDADFPDQNPILMGVIVERLPAVMGALMHRYSFDRGSGALVADSVSGAHGAVKGEGASWGEGTVDLPGGASATAAYVDLPNGLLSAHDNVTFEAWYSLAGAQNWARIWDFGSSGPNGAEGMEFTGPGGDGEGLDYFIISGSRGAENNQQRLEIRQIDPLGEGDPLDQSLTLDTDIPTELGQEVHVAVSWADNGDVVVYRDGEQVQQGNTPHRPGQINDVNNWLGRSNWTGDANMQGSFHEFRIYSDVVPADGIAASYAAGPDSLPAPRDPDLVAHWPLDVIEDGVSPDVVGGHHMTAVNLTGDDVVEGAHGGAVAFDNARETILEYISDGSGDLPINETSPDAYTIAFWANVAGTGQNDLRLFSEGSTTDNGPLFNLGTANNGADDSLDIYIRGGDPTINHPHTTGMPLDGTWNHIAFVQDGAAGHVYINGVLDDIALDLGELPLADAGVLDTTSIGGIRRAAASHWVTGLIDDVKIWSAALSADRIASEAGVGGGAAPIEGLLGYWPDEFTSGGGEILELGTLPVQDLDSDFTWSFWVNPEETDNNNIVFGNRYGPDGNDFSPREFIKFTPRVFEWHWNGAGENVGDFATTGLEVGVWSHNLVVKDGNTLTYYRDGAEIASGEITGAPGNPQPLYLGGQPNAAGDGVVENFVGTFQQVATFNRALSADEAMEVYNRGANGVPLGEVGAPQVTSSKELVDSDFDGMADLIESIAGTDPANPADYFQIRGVQMVEQGLEITFDAAPGIAYEVEHSSDLSENSWKVIGAQRAGEEASTVDFIDSDPNRAKQGYYRARVVQD